jgi:hypothetical protein
MMHAAEPSVLIENSRIKSSKRDGSGTRQFGSATLVPHPEAIAVQLSSDREKDITADGSSRVSVLAG